MFQKQNIESRSIGKSPVLALAESLYSRLWLTNIEVAKRKIKCLWEDLKIFLQGSIIKPQCCHIIFK